MEGYQARRTRTQCRRLVMLCLLLCLLISCKEAAQAPKTFKAEDFPLKTGAEILSVSGEYLYEHPVFYLLFLPGPLFLVTVMFLKKLKVVTFSVPLVFFFLLSFIQSQDNPIKFLDNGLKAYKAKDYNLALTNFTEANKALPSNYLLEYNIAHCYYKLEKPGAAVYALKKALLLNAEDTQVQGFLKLIEAEYGLNSQFNTTPYYHPNIPFIITLVFFNLTFITFTLLLKFKKGQLVIIFIFSILFTLTAAGAMLYGFMHTHQPIGVIVNAPASIRQIPDPTGKERLKLKAGTVIKILWKMQDYVFIRTNIGLKGWVKRDSILMD